MNFPNQPSGVPGDTPLPDPARPERRRRTVLVVDDEPDVRVMVSELLQHYGYRVIEASNGKEALAVLAKERVTILLTDLYMPLMDGIELIRQVRASGYAMPRIIAMSGILSLKQTTVTAAAALLGAHVVLNKPFSADELRSALALAATGEGEANPSV